MYALNLGPDGRILSATYPQYAPEEAVMVNALPEGDISDYLYIDGQYAYDRRSRPQGAENMVWNEAEI